MAGAYPKDGPSKTNWEAIRLENYGNQMFVDPCIILKFIQKNPTRCNSVSKFYYSIFI